MLSVSLLISTPPLQANPFGKMVKFVELDNTEELS